MYLVMVAHNIPYMRSFCFAILLLVITAGYLRAQLYDDENPRSPLAEADKGVLFGDDFESGCWDVSNPKADHDTRCPGQGVLWKHAQLQGPHAIAFVTEPVRSGNYAVRFKWLHQNPGQWEGNPEKVSNNEKKAMLHAPGVKKNKGAERWYGFSVYFPSDGMKKDRFNRLFFQLHATPDHDLNEPWRQPPAAMNLSNEGLTADWTWDSARVSPRNENIVQNRTSIDIPGDWDDYVDRWVDIVWHVKVDCSDNQEGIIEIWVDGKKVADAHGIRFGYNDELGLYPSYGLYWYQGKGEYDHWIYLDEVRIGEGSCSYSDVAPRDP